MHSNVLKLDRLHADVADDLSDETSSHGSLHSGTYSDLKYFNSDEHTANISPTGGDQQSTTATHKSSRFCPEENQTIKQSVAKKLSKQSKNLHDSQRSSSLKEKALMDRRKLSRNRSLVDLHSQLLHRTLVEEVHKRRLFKTVGAVENIGFQAPCEVSKSTRRSSGGTSSTKTTRKGKEKEFQSKRV